MTQYPTAVPNGVPGMQAYNPIQYATPTPIPLAQLTPEQLAMIIQQGQQQKAQSIPAQLASSAGNAAAKGLASKASDALGLGGGAAASQVATGLSTPISSGVGGVLVSPAGTAVASAPLGSAGAVPATLFGTDAAGGAVSTAGSAAAAGASSPWALSGIGSSGNAVLPLAGVAGMGELLYNKRHGTGGAAQGALSGAAMGSYFGPWGALAGALLGGGVGYFGNFGDKNAFQDEYKRAQKLRDAGINWQWNTDKPKVGRSKAELLNPNLAADFAGLDAKYGWVNNKFSQSRKEGDLQNYDLIGYSFLPEILGANYANADLKNKLALADEALKLGVREHHGQIDLANQAKAADLKAFAEKLLGPAKTTPSNLK